MGNMIPHGDRIHECEPGCPEYTKPPVEGRIINHKHDDGRICEINGAGKWIILRCEHGQSTENEECKRTHPEESERRWDLDNALHIGNDRGDFGMPGVGSAGGLVSGVSLDSIRVATGHSMPRTDLAQRVAAQHAPRALSHFYKRNAEYGDDDYFNLGAAGQYVDISRKVQKLKRRWWEHQLPKDGEESDETIVMELIGHLLMSLDYMEQEDGEKGQG